MLKIIFKYHDDKIIDLYLDEEIKLKVPNLKKLQSIYFKCFYLS